MAKQQQNQPESKRVPLIGHLTNRLASASKDQVFYNLVFDIQQNPVTQAVRVTATKRGGFTAYSTVDVGGGVGRGLHYWAQTGKVYSIVDNILYSNTTNIKTLTTSTGRVWFAENTGDVKYLIACDGAAIYLIDTSDVITTLKSASTKTFDGSSAVVVVVATDRITVTGHGWETGQVVVYSSGGGTAIDGLADTESTEHIETFDGSDVATPVVDLAADTIVCTAHGWTTGQRVVYSDGGGTAIVGLTTATQYWIIRIDANTVQLATSRANANLGTQIDLTGAGVGTTHTLTSSSTTATYYVIKIDANTLKLATSLANANAGTAIDLLAVGAGTSHTLVSDPNIPANMISPVSLDTYLFIGESGTEFIYNSNVGDPAIFTQGDFLSAEMYPDNIISLLKYGQYIVAFGSYSLEFFYDNANASGSPLRRTDSISLKAGLAARDSAVIYGKRMIFIGQSEIGGPTVWMFDGLTPNMISSDAVDKILASEGSDLSSAIGHVIHHKGHDLYILRLVSRTLVYDFDSKFWYYWSSNSSGSHVTLPYLYWTEGANNIVLTLHATDGKVYRLNESLNTDDAGHPIVDIVTVPTDFGNMHQKRQHRVELICDKESSGSVSYYWSDDNYQTWSSARTLDLTTRPYTKSLGSFRRRAHRLVHTANAPFRAEALEFEISDGIH